MRIAGFEFRPGFLLTLLTSALIAVLISLGFWQVARMEEKRQLERERYEKAMMPALHITSDTQDPTDIVYRHLTVKGHFIPEYTVFIDNKVYNGKVGFEIVMPFQIEESETAVLVNRGWIKATNSRQNLPQFNTPDNIVKLEGIAKVDTRDVASLGSANRIDKNWPALVRWVEISKLQEDIPYQLKHFLFLQENDTGDGLVREWKFVNSPPEKNLSYAVQWFSLAVVLLLIYIIVNTKRIDNKRV